MYHAKLSANTSSLIADGEIMGAILIGLVQSFRNIQVISGGSATHLVEGIESTAWYPMTNFFHALDEILVHDVDYGPILFRAGIAFIEDWYLNCGGKERVACAADFVRLQAGNGGYSAVHRGDPANIGWLELVELDELAGRAIIDCITPYPKEFERGVFYGGMLMTGEMQYVHIESVGEPYNEHLGRNTVTIHFRKKPGKDMSNLLEKLLAEMSPEKPVTFHAPLDEELAWFTKGIEDRHRNDVLYHQHSSLLLSKATEVIYELSRKLDKLAHQDELTGLPNRRAVFESAKSLLSLSVRQNFPIAFVMIDIDHFKSINDKWGHAVGDETLRLVSGQLRNRLRNSDLLGRIGGEEFLVVLPNSNADDASILAESLRVAVDSMQPGPANQRISLTISLGVSVAEARRGAEWLAVEAYVMQADQALYRSKNNGRNRVTFFS